MIDRRIAGIAVLLMSSVFTTAQPAPAPAAPKTPALSPTARLQAAKTAYLKNAGGSEIPFNVISDGVQGWGRYQIVSSPEKADLIIEVTSPNNGTGVSVSSTTTTDSKTGMPAESVTNSRELQVARITLIVYDAHSKMALWSASEQPKGGLREKSREDHVVASAEHLLGEFRQRVEPDPAK